METPLSAPISTRSECGRQQPSRISPRPVRNRWRGWRWQTRSATGSPPPSSVFRRISGRGSGRRWRTRAPQCQSQETLGARGASIPTIPMSRAKSSLPLNNKHQSYRNAKSGSRKWPHATDVTGGQICSGLRLSSGLTLAPDGSTKGLLLLLFLRLPIRHKIPRWRA